MEQNQNETKFTTEELFGIYAAIVLTFVLGILLIIIVKHPVHGHTALRNKAYGLIIAGFVLTYVRYVISTKCLDWAARWLLMPTFWGLMIAFAVMYAYSRGEWPIEKLSIVYHIFVLLLLPGMFAYLTLTGEPRLQFSQVQESITNEW